MTEAAVNRPSAGEERQAFRRVLEAIASRRSAQDAYAVIADEVRNLLHAAIVAVGLVAPGEETMDFVAVSGGDPAEIVGLRIAAGDTLADPVLRSGKAMVLKSGDVPGHRAGAIAPVVGDKGVIGALIAMDGRGDGEFAADDLELLTVFASMAGLVAECDSAVRSSREKERELAALYEAARTITSTVNLPGVLEAALAAVAHHLPAQTAAVYLLNDERTHLFITADLGLTDDEREVQLAADAGIAAEILASGEPRMVANTGRMPDVDTISPTTRCRSLMAAPVRSGGETMGLMVVTSAQPNAYSQEDLRLLDAVAVQAGIAIHNATLYEDAMRRAEDASALFSFSQRLAASLNVHEILSCVADTSVSLLGVDRFAAMVMDHRDGRLRAVVTRGFEGGELDAVRPRSGEGIPGWVFAWSCPTAVADIPADARNRSAPIHQAGVASCLCVPVATAEATLGVLLAMSTRRRLFTVAEMELLYTVANQAALAMLNAEVYQRAKERAVVMRRYFRRLAAAISSAMDAAKVLQMVTDVALDVMGADRCAIYALRGDRLTLQAESRLPGRCNPDTQIAVGEGLTGTVAAEGRVVSETDLTDNPKAAVHTWHGREQVASYLGLPLRFRRRVTGVLELMAREPRQWSQDEVQLITHFVLKARLGEYLAQEEQT